MKTFRELISWELAQEKRGTRSRPTSAEESAGKIGASVLSKLRYLSTAANPPKGSSDARAGATGSIL